MTYRLWVLLAAFLLSTSSVYSTDYGTATVSAIVSVYDGDTFRADIEDWPAIVGENIPIRVRGVDTPEIRGQCEAEKMRARKARDFAARLLSKAGRSELRNIERGKYFRLVADVWVDGRNLATALIEAGLGRHYDGGRREGWCGTGTE